jgi:hypothetical protein
LYFEELSYERVMDIWELETATGVVVSVGGQLPQVYNLLDPTPFNLLISIEYCTPSSRNRWC